MKKLIGILGGTFDPVHFGHLRIALEIQQQLQLHEIRFIPCQKPVLNKNAQASAEQRLAMLQLAIKDQKNFRTDDRELRRTTPSYTVDTLISLREELPDASLCLILGSDSINTLPQWHHWEKLIELANFIIVPRPGAPFHISDPVVELIQQHKISDPTQLQHAIAGKIFLTELSPLDISSTYIRQQISQNLSPHYLLPDAVYQYIQQQHLYREKNHD